MVVGNGLVANGFKAYDLNNNIIIYAAGISNSSANSKAEFEREQKLVEQTIAEHPEKKFVYFSTCSIYDASLRNSPYVIHKQKMEALIRSVHKSYHIFRISNLAGKTNNPHTVINYFFQHISSGNVFQLWKNASRNLIDVDDAVAVCEYIINNNIYVNQTINIANPENYPVKDIVQAIELITGKKGNYDLVDKGSSPLINTRAIQQIFALVEVEFDNDYLTRLVKKYYFE